MISGRNSVDSNAQRSDEALKFAELFFHKQDRDKESLVEMYHDQASLIWNGSLHKTKTCIAKFYQSQQPCETTVQALDTQIMPPMADIVDMITVVACGKVKHRDLNQNFSRTFILGPNAPGSGVYLIISDTVRTHS